MENIKSQLFLLREDDYKAFSAKLNPVLSPDTILGIRIPNLRALARKLYKEQAYGDFLEELPHEYFEENNLHAFIIEQINDFGECMEMLDKFLPYIDNWATCDCFRPKCFSKNKSALLEKIEEWQNSNHTYTVRFAIGMLMFHFLDDDFKEEYLKTVSEIKSEDYYLNMMIAWYFATALAKRWEETIPYLENRILPSWVHKKTIQKAVESYRITSEQKLYLKSLR